MNRSNDEIQRILSTFRSPDRAAYPELQEYSRNDLYRDFFGGVGLYLAIKMLRTLRLQPGQMVLDLGCGKGETSFSWSNTMGCK